MHVLDNIDGVDAETISFISLQSGLNNYLQNGFSDVGLFMPSPVPIKPAAKMTLRIQEKKNTGDPAESVQIQIIFVASPGFYIAIWRRAGRECCCNLPL